MIEYPVRMEPVVIHQKCSDVAKHDVAKKIMRYCRRDWKSIMLAWIFHRSCRVIHIEYPSVLCGRVM